MNISYRTLPTSDPKEAQLRAEWYEARASGNAQRFERADEQLSNYLWARTETDIAADRKRHPKAKRNQPAVHGNGGRHLP